MADWEDEEDAFLYGGSTSTSAAPTASTSTAGALKAESGTPQPPGQNVNPPISMHEQSTVERADEGEGEADMDEGQDEDEAEDEEDEEEESDDDFQIIMDTNATTAPSSHHDLSRKVGAVPVRPAPGPSLVKELPRQDSLQPTSAGRYADSGSPLKPSPAGGPSNPLVSLQSSIHATGSPIPAPGRTPPPDLNDTSATYKLTRKDETETRPEPQPIVDIDLESIEDKKWRKPGAYLSDYFNYGFDEASWKDWCQKQHTMRKDRDREREHPFHVFADRPLPEAWAALPMELKGLMMQTIMSSFNGASGSQQQQQQQMMQGMMPGMQGMQGNPMAMSNMGGMPMGGMPMGNMGMMGGPGQQHRGLNGGFGGQGMQQQNRNR